MLSLMLSACGKSPARRDDNNANTNMESPKDESSAAVIATNMESPKDESIANKDTSAAVIAVFVVVVGSLVLWMWRMSKKKAKTGAVVGAGAEAEAEAEVGPEGVR